MYTCKYVCVHVDVTSELVALYNVYEFKYIGRAKSMYQHVQLLVVLFSPRSIYVTFKYNSSWLVGLVGILKSDQLV